jgi:hypothetical protein
VPVPVSVSVSVSVSEDEFECGGDAHAFGERWPLSRVLRSSRRLPPAWEAGRGESTCGHAVSSTTRSGQGGPSTASKIPRRLAKGRKEPKSFSGKTIRSTSRVAAVRHTCSGEWLNSAANPTSRPRCRTSHIRQRSAGLAGSESVVVDRSSLQKSERDCRGCLLDLQYNQ